MSDIDTELVYIEEKCLLACALVIQGVWRAYLWKRENPKHVNRLKARAKSRQKKRSKMAEGEVEQEAATQVWEKRFDTDTGYEYYYNLETGDSVWDKPEDYID